MNVAEVDVLHIELEHGDLSFVEHTVVSPPAYCDQSHGALVVGQDVAELETKSAAALVGDAFPQTEDLVGSRIDATERAASWHHPLRLRRERPSQATPVSSNATLVLVAWSRLCEA